MAGKSEGAKRSRRRPGSTLANTAPDQKPFDPEVLDRTVIAIPLLDRINRPDGLDAVHDVIIDVNLDYRGGRDEAKKAIEGLVRRLLGAKRRNQAIDTVKSKYSDQYLFGQLSGTAIRDLVRADVAAGGPHAIYRIWPDFEVKRFTNQSFKTIKADAARNAFGALGDDIVWAVIDTGIDGAHPHFQKFKNLEHGIGHRDFSAAPGADDAASALAALTDENGHGTHVAGIIAGWAATADGLTIGGRRGACSSTGCAWPSTAARAASRTRPISSSTRTRRSCSPTWKPRSCCWRRSAMPAGPRAASVASVMRVRRAARPWAWPTSPRASSRLPIAS